MWGVGQGYGDLCTFLSNCYEPNTDFFKSLKNETENY